MSVVITGWRSRIAEEFRSLIGDEQAIRGNGYAALNADRYLFCQGLLRPQRMLEQHRDEMAETLRINFTSVAVICDEILEANERARICIIGSESGYRGSYDGAYAAAKAAIHGYVETKRLAHPAQQLVAISPGIIGDAGMTLRRDDADNLERRRRAHPKGRFLTSREVALMAHHLLYEQPYVSGTVVRMHGGEA